MKMDRQFKDVFDLRESFAFAVGLAFAPDGENLGDDEDIQNNEIVDESKTGEDEDKGGESESERLKRLAQDKKLSEENAKWRRENRNLAAKLKELEDKDKTELDRLTETANLVPRLEQRNEELLIENAILRECDRYEVRDRELVQMLVSKNAHVKVEDGEVVGIDEAMEDVKKKKPLLFGRADENGDENKDKKTQPGANGASGRATQENKTSNGPDVEKLRQKFPALRR